MKKFLYITTAIVAMMLSFSTLAFTNPFTQLITKATTPHQNTQCQYPPTDPNAFCPCFDQAIVAGCIKYLHEPALCTLTRIKQRIHDVFHNNYGAICNKYPVPGVSYAVCVADMQYFYNTCPV